MEREWIQALSRLTYGIYVLTAADRDEINGMIASWVTQVSFDPPLLLVAVHPNRYTHSLIRSSGAFGLHCLRRDQEEYLTRFKEREPADKFRDLQWKPGQTGTPILEDCLASLECRVQQTLEPGNHTLFLGQILAARLHHDGSPLTVQDYQGTYLGRD